MPYKTFGCSICGKQAPLRLREHGTMSERMKWLREHRKKEHPAAFKASVKKAVSTRRAKDGNWSVGIKRPKRGGGVSLEFKWNKKDFKKLRKVGKAFKGVGSKVGEMDEAMYRKYMRAKNKIRGKF